VRFDELALAPTQREHGRTRQVAASQRVLRR
jgi:hypothetical protein